MGSNNTISTKIDAYAKANLQALKKEEAKTGRKMTKFDIAQYMLQHGKLNKNEYANWMNTQEGFNAQALSKQQTQALRQGNVWGFAGYGGGEESYLDSMTSFSQKNPVEKQNATSGYQMKLNETVAERKKKAAEINNHLKNEKILNQVNFDKKLAELIEKFNDNKWGITRTQIEILEKILESPDSNLTREEKTKLLLKINEEKKKAGEDTKIPEEDKNKDPIELTKEIKKEEEAKAENDGLGILTPDMKKHPIRTILTSPLRGVAYLAAGVFLGPRMYTDMKMAQEEHDYEVKASNNIARIDAENKKLKTAYNKVLTQLLEKSPLQKQILKDRKTLENIINNFPKNKTELEKHINEYSKYANMDKVKSMLFDNASYNDIKECALENLKNALKNDDRYETVHSDENYFEIKDVDAIKGSEKHTKMLYCDLFNAGYTAEQIQDMLPTMNHSVEEIKNIIGDGSYFIVEW